MCASDRVENNVTVDPLDKLIEIEWDVIHSLIKLLSGSRSNRDRVRISNSVAYHANCLNRLLIRKGENPLNDENLGAVLTRVPKKWRLKVLKDFKKWKKKSSLIV